MVRYNLDASRIFSACPFTDNTSALREAWNTPYVSDCHNILIEVMTRIKEGEEDECCGPSDFNNTVMIVQSSGTGKSRMVDEAARLVFTIPFNLQSENNLKSNSLFKIL